MIKDFIDVQERVSILKTIPLSVQHLVTMFGATILFPVILGIDPAIAILMNGVGTLLYTVVTRGKIPAYLGSSFAFLAPCALISAGYGGFAHAQSGFIVFGLFFVLVSLLIKYVGVKWIEVVMPIPVMAVVVTIIGLELAPNAAQQAGLIASSGSMSSAIQDLLKLAQASNLNQHALSTAADNLSKTVNFSSDTSTITISLFTLAVGIIGSVAFKKYFKVIPILTAVVSGYILALLMNQVNFKPVLDAPWFKIPCFSMPVFDIHAIAILTPAFIVVLAEHVGHLIVTGNITGKDMMRNPGLHLSLLGSGLSNVLSGFAGSPPNTTYGENIGVMAITRVYSVWVIRGAALLAIVFSCSGKVSALISTIPDPVLGGVTLLLYGIIASLGLRMFVENKVDFNNSQNIVLAAVTFILGISGASITIGEVQIKGMALAVITGIILSLLFYCLSKLRLLNEECFQRKND